MEMIGSILSFYYVPILVCTGSIGNILSVFVFFKTKLRKLSSSVYLAALAISDTCFLFGLFAQWLNFVDVHIYNRDFFCQFFTYFSSLACFCSAWFVVAFTVERFIAVMYPLRRQTMCTVRRAKIVLFGLTLMGCLHCTPFWILSTPVYSPKLETTICDIKSEYKEYITLLNYWDTIIIFAVPFTTIAILNTFTGCTVWKFATVRRSLTMQKMKTQLTRDALTSSTYRITSLKRQKSTCSHPSGQNNVSRLNCDITRKSRRRKITNSSQLKVTKMLLVVSTVFVCLNLPSYILRIKTFLETQTSANEKTTVVLQYIFQLLFITNFGINFVLYCVSGQNFRKAVLSMFQRVSHRDGTTQVTVSEYYRNSGATGMSTRRRMMTQHCWNEIHEMHLLK
ncbi:cysteinyl leukotriene receptor 1 [Teleopsis dalmanni]|uniref:cysteinyl leukotriene receptor 1 n=1 Tax=Teleopsis dalmanni TaxID=139649 RepID=UPI0018CE57F2|nr:cysteinyl leukotriene receptor 1 [Teleopsis dalmanni]